MDAYYQDNEEDDGYMSEEDTYYQRVVTIDASNESELEKYLNYAKIKTAYHKKGSSIIELAPIDGYRSVKTVDDLEPALKLVHCDNIKNLCISHHISYRAHNGTTNTATDLKRMIEVGTHLPVFTTVVNIQRKGYKRLELYHVDPEFSIVLPSLKQKEGKSFKNIFRDKVEWIKAGGHGGADDIP